MVRFVVVMVVGTDCAASEEEGEREAVTWLCGGCGCGSASPRSCRYVGTPLEQSGVTCHHGESQSQLDNPVSVPRLQSLSPLLQRST